MESELKTMFEEGKREIKDIIRDQLRDVFKRSPKLMKNALFTEGNKIYQALHRAYLSEVVRDAPLDEADRIGSNPFLTEVRQVYFETVGRYTEDAFLTEFCTHELAAIRFKHQEMEPYGSNLPNREALSWSDADVMRWLGGAIGLHEFWNDKSLLQVTHEVGGFPLPTPDAQTSDIESTGSAPASSYPSILVFHEILTMIYDFQGNKEFRPDKTALGEFISALKGTAETLRQNMSPLWQAEESKLFTKADYIEAQRLLLKLGIHESKEFMRAAENAPVKRKR